MPQSAGFRDSKDAMLVQKAIFAVAGLGTRFLPATKANPKAMLPIVDKPLVQYAAGHPVQLTLLGRQMLREL